VNVIDHDQDRAGVARGDQHPPEGPDHLVAVEWPDQRLGRRRHGCESSQDGARLIAHGIEKATIGDDELLDGRRHRRVGAGGVGHIDGDGLEPFVASQPGHLPAEGRFADPGRAAHEDGGQAGGGSGPEDRCSGGQLEIAADEFGWRRRQAGDALLVEPLAGGAGPDAQLPGQGGA
jgi:hypothetical protein